MPSLHRSFVLGTVLLIGAADCARHAPVAPGGNAAAATASACLPDRSGYLRLRVRGAQNFDLDWRDAELTCEGGPRPGQGGLRLTFAERAPGREHRPRLVFGIAAIPGAGSSHAVPTNVTLLFEGEGRVYSTRGDDKCTIDELVQTPLAGRAFRVAGRGFCAAPAASLDGKDDVLVSRFDFAGRVVDGEPTDPPQ